MCYDDSMHRCIEALDYLLRDMNEDSAILLNKLLMCDSESAERCTHVPYIMQVHGMETNSMAPKHYTSRKEIQSRKI
jgi:hypothetical protein